MRLAAARRAYIGHSLRMLSIRWMDTMHVLSFVAISVFISHSLGIHPWPLHQEFAEKQILAKNLSLSNLK